MHYDYDAFVNDFDQLILKFGDYSPDAIVAVARGGVMLGQFLAYRLKLRSLYTINAVFYDETQKRECVSISHIPELSGVEKILVVDDMVDSGESMRAVIERLRESYPQKSFRVATLFYKKDAVFHPDFTLHEADEWIDFFWEVER